eukprot:TRINITY_DN3159_c0_g1_i16.p1 TRINITY_DN3159_c0_g1~~TRINITY_DN3159_c0_g1_i16.p1  ORF type:complete len:167 (-),score=17.55 TRINITY_DN3159_c0_g1_i16:260-760(-)
MPLISTRVCSMLLLLLTAVRTERRRRRSPSDSQCFNSKYDSQTEAGQCEHDCCWGSECGSESECDNVAIIVGVVIGSIALCICVGVGFCFYKKVCCFSSCRRSSRHHNDCQQQPVVVATPAYNQPQPTYITQQGMGQPTYPPVPPAQPPPGYNQPPEYVVSVEKQS